MLQYYCKTILPCEPTTSAPFISSSSSWLTCKPLIFSIFQDVMQVATVWLLEQSRKRRLCGRSSPQLPLWEVYLPPSKSRFICDFEPRHSATTKTITHADTFFGPKTLRHGIQRAHEHGAELATIDAEQEQERRRRRCIHDTGARSHVHRRT